MPNEEKRSPSIITLVVMVLLFIGLFAYGIPFITTGDARWFMGGVSHQPKEFLIWQGGTSSSIKASDPDFAALNSEVERVLTNIVNYSDFGPSEETLAATKNGLALEVLYAEPLTIHTQWNLGNPTRLLFPLSGYYLPERRFFLGQEDKYRAGGPQVDNVQTLISIVTGTLERQGKLLPSTEAGCSVMRNA